MRAPGVGCRTWTTVRRPVGVRVGLRCRRQCRGPCSTTSTRSCRPCPPSPRFPAPAPSTPPPTMPSRLQYPAPLTHSPHPSPRLVPRRRLRLPTGRGRPPQTRSPPRCSAVGCGQRPRLPTPRRLPRRPRCHCPRLLYGPCQSTCRTRSRTRYITTSTRTSTSTNTSGTGHCPYSAPWSHCTRRPMMLTQHRLPHPLPNIDSSGLCLPPRPLPTTATTNRRLVFTSMAAQGEAAAPGHTMSMQRLTGWMSARKTAAAARSGPQRSG